MIELRIYLLTKWDMPRRFKKIGSWWWKKTTIDWIKFASKEEAECYSMLKSGNIDKVTWIAELKWTTLLDARPKAYPLFDKFTAWVYRVLWRRYTADFLIQTNDWEVLLEYKSKYTEGKPDYRLRRSLFLFFYKDKVKFAELIKLKKWDYEYRKYY